MTAYEAALKKFSAAPSGEGASEVVHMAMLASAAGEIDDAALMEAVLMVCDFIYKQRPPPRPN